MVGKKVRELAFQRIGFRQIGDPYGASTDLVLVGWTDAAAGGPDAVAPTARLARSVEASVDVEDQGGIVGEYQGLGRYLHTECAHGFDFIEQRKRVDDNAGTDDRQPAWTHDSGRQQAELVGLALDHQGMACVVPALEPHHHVGAFRQPVDNLALALVAPLRPDHRYIAHGTSFNSDCRPRTRGPRLLPVGRPAGHACTRGPMPGRRCRRRAEVRHR